MITHQTTIPTESGPKPVSTHIDKVNGRYRVRCFIGRTMFLQMQFNSERTYFEVAEFAEKKHWQYVNRLKFERKSA